MNKLTVGSATYKILNISGGEFDEDIQGHTHGENCYEMHYVYAGRGSLETKEKSYKLSEGCVYVNGPMLWHKQSIDRENPLCEICIFIQLQESGDDVISHIFNSTNLYLGKGSKELKSLFFKVLELNKSKDIYSAQQKICYIELIIIQLSKMYSPRLIANTEATLDDKKFYIIDVSFLHDYASLSLEELSNKLGISPRQTQRILKKHYGKGFREKKREAQCDAALLMLQQGKSVSDTAQLVGYSDTPSFIRAFKATHSTTPSKAIFCND